MHRPLNICQLMGEFVIKPPVKCILEPVMSHQPQHMMLFVCADANLTRNSLEILKLNKYYGHLKIWHTGFDYYFGGWCAYMCDDCC